MTATTVETTTVGGYVSGVRDLLVAKLGLEEVFAADGGPWLSLGGEAPIGAARQFRGTGLARLVHVGVDLPDGSMAAHMLIAHTEAGSAVPHLAIDLMRFPENYGFFVDLLPRVDLCAELGYVDEVYAPLDRTFERLESTEGLVQVPMPPRMLAFYSPWMLHKFSCPDLGFLLETIDPFVDRFVDLLENGLRTTGLPDAESLAVRDQKHRDVLFDPDFDPVWKQVTPLLGEAAVTTIRETLGSSLR